MASPMARGLATIPIAIGVLLHAYTVLFLAEGAFGFFQIGIFFWSCLPYAICVVMWKYGWTAPAAFGATFAGAADLWMHYQVFVAPRGSTAALGLLFMPLWNLFIVVPLGALLGSWIGKRWGRRKAV